jgi:dihydroxyacetone kinase
MELAAEFNTENTDEAILKILELGSLQNMEVSRFTHQLNNVISWTQY